MPKTPKTEVFYCFRLALTSPLFALPKINSHLTENI